jgi:hypothetical protein
VLLGLPFLFSCSLGLCPCVATGSKIFVLQYVLGKRRYTYSALTCLISNNWTSMQGESYQLVSLGSFSTIYVTSDLVKHRTWLTFKGLLFKKIKGL